MKIDNVEEMLLLFEKAAALYTKAIGEGDYKTANQNHKILEQIVKALKEKDKLNELNKLLTNNNIGVQASAAIYLLYVNNDMIHILQNIVNNKDAGAIALIAKIALSEWSKRQTK